MSGPPPDPDLARSARGLGPAAAGDRPASGENRSAIWTPLELVRWTAEYFARAGIASPRLDAELLLAHALGCRRLDLYLQFERPVEPEERARYRELVRRRAQQRIPVAQLLGEREFWSRAFHVTADVLVPRPETELLVELCAAGAPRRVLDFGTGSGNVAVALASELEGARVVAVDRSPAALRVAARNVARHEVGDRVLLVRASSLAPLRGSLPGRPLTEGAFDAIVSNPPYIPTGELGSLAPELAHEPREALDGGGDGLDVIRALVAEAASLLGPGGRLLMEIGAGQAEAVKGLAHADLGSVEVFRDLAGIERVVVFHKAVERARTPGHAGAGPTDVETPALGSAGADGELPC